MSGQDKILLGFTFIVGIVSGMYFYTVSFEPTFLPGRDADIEEADALSVVGRAYGGHTLSEYVHPSFRIAEDGSYEYFPGGEDADKSVEGHLPRALMNRLTDEIETADLYGLSLESPKDFCTTYVDGFDYVYRVIYEGERYELDTCTSAMPYENDLALVLMDVWEYLETGAYEAETGSGRNPAEEWLRRQFDWREQAAREDEPVACTMEAKICSDGSAVGRTGPNCEFAACPGE